jgi:hypothetical protein
MRPSAQGRRRWPAEAIFSHVKQAHAPSSSVSIAVIHLLLLLVAGAMPALLVPLPRVVPDATKRGVGLNLIKLGMLPCATQLLHQFQPSTCGWGDVEEALEAQRRRSRCRNASKRQQLLLIGATVTCSETLGVPSGGRTEAAENVQRAIFSIFNQQTGAVSCRQQTNYGHSSTWQTPRSEVAPAAQTAIPRRTVWERRRPSRSKQYHGSGPCSVFARTTIIAWVGTHGRGVINQRTRGALGENESSTKPFTLLVQIDNYKWRCAIPKPKPQVVG